MQMAATKADTLEVTSETFKEGELIPSSAAHGFVGGANLSPQLSWTPGPDGTKSYAVSCWDPDAPTTVGFTHWVLFDIPAGTTSLEEGAGTKGGSHGFSDWGESAYGGMAPPAGDSPHHYQFTVYALDVEKIGLDDHTTYPRFRFTIKDHILASGTLVGLYAVPADGQ
jgi:Raf kinase inhibitor-like YbhB/YbcL family protein